MIELIKAACRDQYGAALMMVRNSLERCRSENWTRPVGRFPFWQVAYHTLYCTDLYLAPSEHAFTPPPFHRETFERMGGQNGPPAEAALAAQPLVKAILVNYCDDCLNAMNRVVMGESEAILRGESGFSWLTFSRLEAHLYNIRHIQHHAGQLNAFLSREQAEEKQWVRTYTPTESRT